MKKIILNILILITVLALNVAALDYKVFESDDVVVENVNWYRADIVDFTEKKLAGKFEINMDNISAELVEKHKASLEYNELLDNVSFIRLSDMFENEFVGPFTSDNKTATDLAAHMGFEGFLSEVVVFLGFENYIEPSDALNILLDYALYNGILNRRGYAPINYPYYDKVGSSFMGGTIELDNKTYNVYGLDMVLGW